MATKKPEPIGKLCDDLWKVKQEKAAWAKLEADFDLRIKELETKIFEAFDAQETTAGRGTKCSVSLGTSTVFNIDDFDALAKYIKRTGYFHLFQRRITVAAARELFEKNGKVPGLAPFEKRVLNITTTK